MVSVEEIKSMRNLCPAGGEAILEMREIVSYVEKRDKE